MTEKKPDTQWSRFMVFQREEAGGKFHHAGTVHAPDIYLALLNGRDVFTRRPKTTSLWVVPADLIFSVTKEEIEIGKWDQTKMEKGSEEIDFHVFGKGYEQGQCEQIGSVKSSFHEEAVAKAIKKYTSDNILMWWVFPSNSVLSSDDGDAESMFGPASKHDFKDQAYYPVQTMMRQIKTKGKLKG